MVQVVNISSLMGSVQTTLDRRATYGATYRCSKAAQVTAGESVKEAGLLCAI